MASRSMAMLGWAGGSGRIGGIAFPYAGGLALTIFLPLETILLLVAVPAVLIALLILLLGAVRGEPRLAQAHPRPA